jgi:4-hydroxysphinganine ceramide fatty acyl 2-hydroxylase
LFIPVSILYPERAFWAVVAGAQFMYIIYDMIHYWIHHANPAEGTYFRELKVYHMQHHFKNGTMGFGVSSKFWDVVFGTTLSTRDIKKE